MSSSSAAPQPPTSPDAGPRLYQDQLLAYCRDHNLMIPSWQIMSDRRGGRTAWSSIVTVHGQQIPARFWYDGQYVNNAKEDAAQMALQKLGQLPPSGVAPAHLQQQTQQNSGQPRYNPHGKISS